MSVSIHGSQVQRISSELHRMVAESEEQTLWLAMDGAEEPWPEIEGIDWARRTAVELRLPHSEIDSRWHPKWLALYLGRAEDAHILNHSIAWALEEASPRHLRAGLGRRVAGWLVTDEHSVQAAAQHWARLMVRSLPSVRGNFLLRLHDPAVLWNVWQILTPVQRMQWLGPLNQWCLLDPMGGLSRLRAHKHIQGVSEHMSAPDLSPLQWQDIKNITPLHQAMRCYESAKWTTAEDVKRLALTGLRALRRANEHGLSDLHSLSLFAELSLTRHSNFDEHPVLQRLLRQRDADEPLGGLLSELTELDWQRITGEINQKLNLG